MSAMRSARVFWVYRNHQHQRTVPICFLGTPLAFAATVQPTMSADSRCTAGSGGASGTGYTRATLRSAAPKTPGTAMYKQIVIDWRPTAKTCGFD